MGVTAGVKTFGEGALLAEESFVTFPALWSILSSAAARPVNPIPFSFSVLSSPKLHWNIKELIFKLSLVFASAIEIFLISLSPNNFPQLRASLLAGAIIFTII